MAKVKLVTLGTVRQALGTGTDACEVEVAGNTVRDVLAAVPAPDGRTLLQVLTNERGELSPDYMIRLDGG